MHATQHKEENAPRSTVIEAFPRSASNYGAFQVPTIGRTAGMAYSI